MKEINKEGNIINQTVGRSLTQPPGGITPAQPHTGDYRFLRRENWSI